MTAAPRRRAAGADPSDAPPGKRPPRNAQASSSPSPAVALARRGDPAGERVAKVLARAGVASRREVERLIEAGKVTLDGAVLTSPAINVRPGDRLAVEGRPVTAAEATRLFRYHKPAGLVTTHEDPRGRPTVFAALPAGLPRLISIGRLDLNSEGLLLLTNDGELSRALELPSNGWPRRYRARAYGRIDQARLDGLKDGITVEGVRYGPIEASLDKAREGPTGANLWITLTLAEGKNREVRRVLEALGLTVNRLIRLAYGPFALGTLAVGAVEEVGPRVIREQLEGLVAPASMPAGDRALFRAPAGGAGRRAQTARGAAAEARAAGETPEPIVYKPGWARPRKKPPGGAGPKARSGGAKAAAPPRDHPGKTGTRQPSRSTRRAEGPD
jgi:23S rRNA pseudouridine2605 synthase